MKFAVLLLFLFLSMSMVAQIGGISGSKLNSVCVKVVEHRALEVEPSFSYARSRYYWDDKGDKKHRFLSDDSLSINSGMRFRFTYGLFDHLEVGVTVPADASSGSWGLRYELSETEKLCFALMAGMNTPFGTGTRGHAIRTIENTWQAGIGAVGSWHASPEFSIDMNAQFGSYLKPLHDEADKMVQVGADAGYYLFEGKLQLIAGLSYQSNFSGPDRQNVLTLYPGITVEAARDFLLVIHNSMDIAGRNLDKQSVFDVSITILLH